MIYELEWTELSAADYDRLDGSEKVVVDKGLKKIKTFGMQAGAPLSGELTGCRKLKHRKMGLRVIFRKSPNGIEIIQASEVKFAHYQKRGAGSGCVQNDVVNVE